MSTPLWARAVHRAAREPGSSRTVVRIRQSAADGASAAGSPLAVALVAPLVVATAAGAAAGVVPGGGAWL